MASVSVLGEAGVEEVTEVPRRGVCLGSMTLSSYDKLTSILN